MLQCCYGDGFDVSVDKSILAVNSNENWPSAPPVWSDLQKSLLLSEKNTLQLPDLSVDEIIESSSKFPVPFPIETVRCHSLRENVGQDVLERHINSVYPVIHENALHLCATFLTYQVQHGNAAFYKDMSLTDLIDRLLTKRAVAFLGTVDHYLLLDGTENCGGWEKVGTDKEKPPLTLENCLSYDEMKLAALLSVSSFTCFINDGNRRNRGKPQTENVDPSGVVIGLIGTRLPKRNVMEYREIVKSPDQNTTKNGYGRKCPQPTLQHRFLEFYGDINATYSELVQLMKTTPDRYLDLGSGLFFDKVMYKRRIALSFDTLLVEANDRARRAGTNAFVHVVGIGLGVWRICFEQNRLFAETCAERLGFLQGHLPNISDVCFAYIGEKTIGPYRDGDTVGGITIHIDDRNPHQKLEGIHAGKLLVVSYAWDCNALPGNEFWLGSLVTSSDPAAACSTQVAELHNPQINAKVRGGGLRVATLNHGLVTFGEYQQLHKND